MSLLEQVMGRYSNSDEIPLLQYLDRCKQDPTVYATAAERMVAAIGQEVVQDTMKNPRLSRIFPGRILRTYPVFQGERYQGLSLHGLEDPLEKIVAYFRHAAQGMEEKKQILYLHGPVGAGKSTIVQILKLLMEELSFYALKGSPINESPLGLFDVHRDGALLESEYGIPARYITTASPWAMRKLIHEYGGDVGKFKVVKKRPSISGQVAIAKIEPGDGNCQGTSLLIGKAVSDGIPQSHSLESYFYTGGLCLANRGLLDFVEMFKTRLEVLNPLLTATQDGNYAGAEGIGPIPFDGIVVAHSNEEEWAVFKNHAGSKGLLDRIVDVEVPYCLRVDEEIAIYQQILSQSTLAHKPCAPRTLKVAAEFAIGTRVSADTGVIRHMITLVYNGEEPKEIDKSAKSAMEYRAASRNDGMGGFSTRFIFKVLSRVFNSDPANVGADPIHLFAVLFEELDRAKLPEGEKHRAYLKEVLIPRYREFLKKEMQIAYLESYGGYGQHVFDRYLLVADSWIQSQSFYDSDTGETLPIGALGEELRGYEVLFKFTDSAAREFRNRLVQQSLRAQGSGKIFEWTSDKMVREMIEYRIFSDERHVVQVISFAPRDDKDEVKKHENFVARMMERGYTEKQVRVLVDWYLHPPTYK